MDDEFAKWGWRGTSVTIDLTTLVVLLISSLLTCLNPLTFEATVGPIASLSLSILEQIKVVVVL